MTKSAVAIAAAVLVNLCLGFGGFDANLSFLDYAGLNDALTGLNRGWEGTGSFNASGPQFWLGGHGAGFAGDVSIGGRGMVGVRAMEADAMQAEMAGGFGFVEVGYRYAPFDFIWVRPTVDLGGGAWVFYAHDRSSPYGEPDFSRWWLGWTMGGAPGLEVMGRLRHDVDKYVGLFVKGSYFIPFYGPDWYLDGGEPEFGFRGFQMQVGLRFGVYPPSRMRI